MKRFGFILSVLFAFSVIFIITKIKELQKSRNTDEGKELTKIMQETGNRPIPMAICPKCGNIGIGEELIGQQCSSCGEITVRYDSQNKKAISDTAGFRITGEGRVMIGTVVEKQVCITIDTYNALTKDSEWELLDAYLRNNVYLTSWRSRKTGEYIEAIGLHPPQERLIIKDSKSGLIEMEKRPDKITFSLLSEEQGGYKYSVTAEIDGKTRYYVMTSPMPLLRPYSVGLPPPQKRLIIQAKEIVERRLSDR